MYIAIGAVLAMYAVGKMTGIALDSGAGVSHTVPIYEGYAIQHSISRLHLAGCDLTNYLIKILKTSGHSFTTTAEREIVRDIKETFGYVAENYEHELKKAEISSDTVCNYMLPDGEVINIGSERFRCTEVLFKPHLIGLESLGLQTLTHQSIMKCNIDIRRDLFQNIVLSGGTMMFQGIDARLIKELKETAPQSVRVNVVSRSASDRQNLVWIGGSILSSLHSFREMWISGDEYCETGTSIVHRKCF
eukprot:549635_1